MKIILPSLAWFAISAGLVFAQSRPQQPVSVPLSIKPPEVPATLPNVGSAATAPLGLSEVASNLPSSASIGGPATAYGAAQAANISPAATNPAVTGSAATTDAVASNGIDLFMQRVIGAGEQLSSVETRIRYRAYLFGQQTIGTGLYLQQDSGEARKFRLELKTPIGQQLMTMQQVCDGKYLWQLQDIPNKTKNSTPDQTTISRVDLRKVRQMLADADPSLHVDLAKQFALGGLPKLLNNLQSSFRFSRVEAGRLDILPVWIATGTWRPEALATISKDLAMQAALDQPLNAKLLPPQLPEQVCLFVGQDDFFPYRIEYRRRTGTQSRAGGTVRDDTFSMITVEFYEVRLNGPINAREFDYQPGTAGVVDTTDNFIKGLQEKK
ncbi:MAG TPA: hypothetical protein VFE46_06755 [Pirellulales bacterium]|jgi:hypothetical protein|nr:hypothetical protein [Pirellulales bacterium]